MAGHRIVYLTYFEVSDTNKNLLRKNCASSRCRWVAGTIVQIVESGLQRSIVVLAVDTPSFKEDFLQVLLDEVFFSYNYKRQFHKYMSCESPSRIKLVLVLT